MKRLLALTLAALLALGLTACGGGSQEQAAEETETGQYAGMPNPWTDVETPEEAAEGAGVGSFQVPEDGTETSAGQVAWESFRYMENLAEADGRLGTADLTVRKGVSQDGEDVSGDYTEYAYEWTLDVNGCQVPCGGSEEGLAMRVTWSAGDFDYSICVRDLDDPDAACGLDESAVEQLVTATR